jgi:predicted nucleotidyltransferase
LGSGAVWYEEPMNRDAAIAARADALRARGVAAAYFFGSTAQNEARADSDLDVFVDVAPGAKFSLLNLAGVHRLLNDGSSAKVDVTTRASLPPEFKAAIEREAVRVV